MSEKIDIIGVSDNLAEIANSEFAEQDEVGSLRVLGKFSVGISISESEDAEQRGLSETHQKDYMIEIARHLLVQRATLIYGGDLRTGGYTQLFSELSFQYRDRADRNRFPFKNYFSYPIHINLTTSDLADLKENRVQVVKVPPAPELSVDPTEYIEPDTMEGMYVWSRSLSFMRDRMDQDTNARVFVGGRNYGFKGKYPGIIEEAYYAYRSNKPIYLVGGFGGATLKLIEAFDAKPVIDSNSPFYKNENRESFFDYHNELSPDDPMNYGDLNTFFSSKTVDWLSDNNGLSIEENQQLFHTQQLPEVVYLIMKGLNAVAK